MTDADTIRRAAIVLRIVANIYGKISGHDAPPAWREVVRRCEERLDDALHPDDNGPPSYRNDGLAMARLADDLDDVLANMLRDASDAERFRTLRRLLVEAAHD